MPLSQRRWLVSLVGWMTILVVGAFGCTAEEPNTQEAPPSFEGIDTSLSCPAGEVGWNFSTGGSSLSTTRGSSLSGIRIASATYGKNCGAQLTDNATSPMASVCNGENQCTFTPGFSYDPAVNCAKNFDVTWQCGTESTPYTLHVDGESGGKPVRIDCGPKLTITQATFGGNCGVAAGSHTAPIKAVCDTTRQCNYSITNLGDPKVGCKKDYSVTYTCGDNPATYTKTLPGEAGGQTVTLACDASPTIVLDEVVYGSNCGVTKAYPPPATDLKNQCQGRTSCDYKIETAKLGDPKFGCRKNWRAGYHCGESWVQYTVDVSEEADGKTAKLSCVGAGGFDPSTSARYATGERACIPKTCAWNEKRDARMKCVSDPSKQLISGAALDAAGLLDRSGAEPANGFLRANTPYKLRLSVDVAAPPGVRPRMVPWFTSKFGNTSTGDIAEGYVCAGTPVEVAKSAPFEVIQKVEGASRANILPADCYDARANAWADAAKRRGMTEKDFRAKFTLLEQNMHLSIDPEGEYGFVKNPNVVPNAPNPPGFYYDQARDYVDMISFYQQRELTELNRDALGQSLFGSKRTVASSRPLTLSPSGNIEVGLNDVKITDGAFQALDWFSTIPPITSIDVDAYLSGDWPNNPLSPSSTAQTPNLRRRNLRATVEVFPYNDEGGAIVLGTIPIAEPAPTGKVKSVKLSWPSALRDRVFGQWGGVASLDMKVCIDVDGTNTRNGGKTEIVDPVTGYKATIDNGRCLRKTNALVFTREFTKRPLPAERSSSDIANGTTNTSGDAKTSANQESGLEKGCVESGTGANATKRCSSTRRASMGASGDLTNTYYSSQSTTSLTETSQKVTAAPALKGEALGYQVVDVDDNDQVGEFAKSGTIFKAQTPVKISIAPNWDLVVNALRAPPPPKPEWNKGIYGGQMGIGVGLGAKVPFGGFGVLTIAATVGISISLDFEMLFQPPNPYGCINGTNTKCFFANPTPLTQPAAQKFCQVRGGRLAEMRTSNDRSGIQAAAQGNFQHWVGGQLAYSFTNASCARDQGSTACKDASTTSYRWIGSDVELASSPGQSSTVSLNSTNTSLQSSENGLATNIPVDSGIVYQGVTKRVSTSAQGVQLPSVCELEPAASISYSQWTVGLNLGAGAGVGLSFCTPTEEVGLCLVGQLNFVDISLRPLMGHTSFTLLDAAGNRRGIRGSSFLDIPWQISLLAGQIALTANFYFGSTSWTIASYDGFKVAEGSLARYEVPFRSDFQ